MLRLQGGSGCNGISFHGAGERVGGRVPAAGRSAAYDVSLLATARQPRGDANGLATANRLGASIGDLATAVIAD